MGLTNGTNNSGLGRYNANTAFINNSIGNYGKPVGSAYSSTTELTGTFGITTDSTKSGIIIEPDTDIRMIIKY